MRGITVFSFVMSLFTLGLAGPTPAQAARNNPITIGTGSVTGIYYPTGCGICRMVNAGKSKHGITCNAESTAGSQLNVSMMEEGKLDMAIVQSDVGYQALEGSEPFTTKARNLRSVFSIHSETVTLVARKGSGITSLMDIKGKRVNLGNPGSGPRQTVGELFKACGIKESQLKKAGTLPTDAMPELLEENEWDAFFTVIGHPAFNIREAATYTNVDIVEIKGDCVDQLIQERPYYVRATIPGGTYRGNDSPVTTIGTKATLITSSKVPDRVVYQLVKSVFENLKEFRGLHPAYGDLTAEDMTHALSAPFHAGAAKYFKEKGLQ